VLRRIIRPKRDEIIGGWTKLHNEELHKLNASSDEVRMIKSRRMSWTGHGEEELIWDPGVKAKTKETSRKTWT
jgi:hypothetical protein